MEEEQREDATEQQPDSVAGSYVTAVSGAREATLPH